MCTSDWRWSSRCKLSDGENINNKAETLLTFRKERHILDLIWIWLTLGNASHVFTPRTGVVHYSTRAVPYARARSSGTVVVLPSAHGKQDRTLQDPIDHSTWYSGLEARIEEVTIILKHSVVFYAGEEDPTHTTTYTACTHNADQQWKTFFYQHAEKNITTTLVSYYVQQLHKKMPIILILSTPCQTRRYRTPKDVTLTPTVPGVGSDTLVK